MSFISSLTTACFTRIERFSAAHRLNSVFLTSDENVKVYGPCNRINGHGHNYKVEFTIKGPIDMKTGMVVPLDHLKRVIKAKVLDVLDHSNLDIDIEWFKKRPSTTENLAVFIWESINQDLLPWNLYKLKIWETDSNIVIYKGESKSQ